jgi:WD40 repeat protein
MASADRLIEVFNEAKAQPAGAERERLVAMACSDEPGLKEQVLALLQAHEAAGDFLKQTQLISPAVLLKEKAGDRIGRYKLLQQIGEGGCGVVYMAEQEEPVRRRVALKVIKLGMDTKQVIARFEAERQALALMDHPNIAKVLDAGATDTGRPYFVMELVRGIKITDFCDENKLSTTDRLNLFIQVCQAIQHAHQKGVIHRDIKPSNILVTINDGVPVPKVIDFGIAKATQGRLTDHTLFTAFEQFIGTPAYMSPEQAVMTSLDIDTRSDIYSLGVLLYELLTGRTPFDQKELLAAGLDEMRRTIREKEPLRPSTRLSTMLEGELTTTAKHRHTDAPKLVHLLRGELDWIVMKSLEKDRSRRYETANGLAREIERYLNDEPVSVAAPGIGYRVKKFSRRHRVALAISAGFAVLLAGGVLVSTWQAVRASRNAAEAGKQAIRAGKLARDELEQRQRAEQLAEQSRQNLYAARISLAQQAFEQGDVTRVMELLASLRPEPSQEDLRGFEWYYLWRVCHTERLNLTGHEGRVRAVAFNPEDPTIATAGDDAIIRFWDTANGQPRGSLGGHAGRISSLAFSLDGKMLASGGADKTVRLWDVAGRKQLWASAEFTHHVTALAFSCRGLLAAAQGVMATGRGKPSTRFVPVGGSGDVKIWNSVNFQQVASFPRGETNGTVSLAFSPDGNFLACGGVEGEVEIWNVTSKAKLASLNGSGGGPIVALAFAPGGRLLANVGWYPNNTLADVRFWDTKSWNELSERRFSAHSTRCLAFAPDGETLVTGGTDQTVRLWDVDSGRERASFKGHSDVVWAVGFSPDGRTIASGSWDGSVKLWHATDRQEADMLIDAPDLATVFAADSKTLVCGGGGDIQVWNTAERRLLLTLPSPDETILAVALACSNKVIVAKGISGDLFLFDLDSRQPRRMPTAPQGPISCFVVSPDGKLLATGSRDRTIALRDPATGIEQATFKAHTSTVSTLAFTPDGGTLVSGSDKEMKFWDLATHEVTATVDEPASRLAVAPNGRILASGTADQGIKLRDLKTRRELATIKGHKDQVYCINFSADSKTLATASWDGTCKLWRVPDGNLLLTFHPGLGVKWSASFSPDNRTLAIGGGEGPQIALLRAGTEKSGVVSDAAEQATPGAARSGVSDTQELARRFLLRDPAASTNLVDLSAFYNASLTEAWHGYGSSDLRELPRGIQIFAGVQFDVRGLIQLTASSRGHQRYPDELRDIPVQRPCHKLHFLHAAIFAAGTADGAKIGSYIVRYASGAQSEIPIIIGESLADWWTQPNEENKTFTIAWVGQNAESRRRGKTIRLFKSTWVNPTPAETVSAIDFIAFQGQAPAPFLVAVTAEP